MKTVFIVLLAEVYSGTVATTYIERGNVFFFQIIPFNFKEACNGLYRDIRCSSV